MRAHVGMRVCVCVCTHAVCVHMWARVCVCVLMQCVCVCVSYLLQVFLPFLLLKCPLVLLDETFPAHPAREQSQQDQSG